MKIKSVLTDDCMNANAQLCSNDQRIFSTAEIEREKIVIFIIQKSREKRMKEKNKRKLNEANRPTFNAI